MLYKITDYPDCDPKEFVELSRLDLLTKNKRLLGIEYHDNQWHLEIDLEYVSVSALDFIFKHRTIQLTTVFLDFWCHHPKEFATIVEYFLKTVKWQKFILAWICLRDYEQIYELIDVCGFHFRRSFVNLCAKYNSAALIKKMINIEHFTINPSVVKIAIENGSADVLIYLADFVHESLVPSIPGLVSLAELMQIDELWLFEKACVYHWTEILNYYQIVDQKTVNRTCIASKNGLLEYVQSMVPYMTVEEVMQAVDKAVEFGYDGLAIAIVEYLVNYRGMDENILALYQSAVRI